MDNPATNKVINRLSPASIATVSFVLYIVACFLPSLVFDDGHGLVNWPGYECLAMGILAPLVGQFAEFSNYLYYLSLILLFLGKRRPAFWLSIFALINSFNTFLLYFQNLPQNEGGVGPSLKFLYPHIGFYVWFASMATVAIGVALMIRRDAEKSVPK